MTEIIRVTSAAFQRTFGILADKALIEPVAITKHGRDHLVVLSAKEYTRLKRRDRQFGSQMNPLRCGANDHARPILQAFLWQRVLALPITHSPPSDPDLVQEIPVVVRRHLRLDDERSWIILSETSEFHWPGPDLGHSAPGSALVYERLPPRFFEKIQQRFIATITAGRTARIRRTK